MDGMLSQEEINALLNGMNSDDVAEAAASSATSGEIDESLLTDAALKTKRPYI